MKFALHFGNNTFSDPEGARRLVRLAEAAGFDRCSLVQSVQASNLLAQRRNLLVEPRDLGFRHRLPLTVGAVELREITGNALVNLRQTALHLGLSKVPIPRVDGLKLAAVNRNARFAEQFKATAQHHELAANLALRHCPSESRLSS